MRSAKRVFVLVGLPVVLGIGGSASVARASISETLGSSFQLDPSFQTGETVGGTGTAPTQSVTNGDSEGILDSFASTTLSAGDTLTFSGTITFPAADTGGVQYRIGLFNTNGNTLSANSTGMLGYIAEIPNGSDGAGTILGRNSGSDWSSTGATGLANITSTSPGVNAPGGTISENFSLTVTYNGVGLGTNISETLVSTDGPPATYNQALAAKDTTTTSNSNTVYNELGFFSGGSTFSGNAGFTTGTINYSNLAVTYTPAVPEPASVCMLGLGSLSLLGRRRRGRAV